MGIMDCSVMRMRPLILVEDIPTMKMAFADLRRLRFIKTRIAARDVMHETETFVETDMVGSEKSTSDGGGGASEDGGGEDDGESDPPPLTGGHSVSPFRVLSASIAFLLVLTHTYVLCRVAPLLPEINAGSIVAVSTILLAQLRLIQYIIRSLHIRATRK